MLHDVRSLWLDNRDKPHSNVYYTALRVWFTGINSHGDIGFTSSWAFCLNKIFFGISFFAIYKLASKIFESKWIALMVVFVSFINTASISNSIFLRPYQLQESIVSLYLLSSFLLLKDNPSTRFLISHSLITAFTVLSGYFAVFLVALISIAILPCLIAKYWGDWKFASWFAVKYVALTSVISYAIYPPYFFVYGGRQDEAYSKLGNVSDNVISSIRSLSMLNDYFPVGLIIVILSAIVSLTFFVKKMKLIPENHYYLAALSVSTLLWIVIVQFFSPYKNLPRYIYPILPVVGLFYGYIIYLMKGRFQFISQAKIVVAIVIMLAAIMTYNNGPEVENINRNRHIECDKIPDGSVIYAKTPWKLANILTCLKDNVKYGLSGKIHIDMSKAKGYKYILSDEKMNDPRVKDEGVNVMYFEVNSIK
ncbi:hypothetical protein [Citrobacter sp. CK180]|uniref:hypothetical protein n=1 Tax=Citrobacter sp. CK180 TaxID=2985089 RepID=UPI002577E595|nr:hypothetical protein [Citrobacter sp. CK180]MDM3063454.1 hypothetical protein [Citrobacter sp. CK180]